MGIWKGIISPFATGDGGSGSRLRVWMVRTCLWPSLWRWWTASRARLVDYQSWQVLGVQRRHTRLQKPLPRKCNRK